MEEACALTLHMNNCRGESLESSHSGHARVLNGTTHQNNRSETELRAFPAQGTVLIHNAQELTDYSRSEEDKLSSLIQGIVDSGATVVAAGAAIGEMAMHFLEKAGVMVLR